MPATAAVETTVSLPEWADPFLRPARYKSARGGRGSGKSHTFAQISILRMAGLLPWYPSSSVRIASCRSFETSIAESVKVAVEIYIKKLGLSSEFDVQKFAINHRNGSHMFFPGVTRKVESFMSMEDIDVFWMEQAETLQDEMYKVEPSIRKKGSELWFVWNPMNRTDWCWKRFVANPEDGDVSVEVNYQDNPWWTDELEKMRVYYKKNEPSLYAWMWLGQPKVDSQNQVLSYEVLEQCVDAWKQGLAPKQDDAPVTDAGLDIAEGGKDKCSSVVRVGPTVEDVDAWPGVAGDLSVAARRTHENVREHDIYRLYYDASAPMLSEFRRIGTPYAVRPVAFGGEVSGKNVLYESKRKNGAVFARRNIQMADALRLRANRTVRLLKGDKSIDPIDCLFIRADLRNLEAFLADLSQPIRRVNPTTGKWELDKRGGDAAADSPDKFDALCLSFARDSEGGLKAR